MRWLDRTNRMRGITSPVFHTYLALGADCPDLKYHARQSSFGHRWEVAQQNRGFVPEVMFTDLTEGEARKVAQALAIVANKGQRIGLD